MTHHGFNLKGGTTFLLILYFVLSYWDYNDDTPLALSNGIGCKKLEDYVFMVQCKPMVQTFNG
jgi:hypothetical protein